MEKIIITGANGFIGSNLIDFCIKKDIDIYALERPDQVYRNLTRYLSGKIRFERDEKQEIFGENIKIPTNNKNLKIIECNIKNVLLLEKIIKEIQPKYLFHFAAQPYIILSWNDPVDTIETNVIGTINIFESIKKHNIKTRVILACSSTEYGTTAKINKSLKETDPLMAIHPYGISKIAAELLARQYYINFGIEIINLRFFNQTGLRRINDASSDFIRKVAQIELGLSEPVIEVGNLNPFRDFTGIKDAINAIWLAAKRGTPGETYNLCSGKKIQIRQILNIALSFSSKKIDVLENVSDKLRKTDEDIIIGDNSKIKKELGWDISVPIEETLEEMYEYWLDYYKKYGV